VLSVLPAAVAAVLLGVGSVLQHRVATTVPTSVGPVRLFLRLLRRPQWLVGRAMDLTALGLQTIAFANGRLAVVQAVTTGGVVIALATTAVLDHRRPTVRELGGALAIVAGVALLLAVVGADDDGPTVDLLYLAVVAVIGLAIAVVVARWVSVRVAAASHPAGAASIMAGATAVAFSLDAVFLKSTGLSVRADDDLVRIAVLGAGFVVCAGLGNLLVQRSFQLGPLSASLPVVTAGQPVSGALLGAMLFAERPDGVGAALALVVGLVLVAGGAFTAVRAGTPGPAGAAAAAAHEDVAVPAPTTPGEPRATPGPAFDPVAAAPGLAQVTLGSAGADLAPPARPRRSPSLRRNSA
jgi:drug/metabolite transporter (DMT)-like permease